MDFLGYFMKYFYIFVSLAGFVGGGVSYFFKKNKIRLVCTISVIGFNFRSDVFLLITQDLFLNAPSQYVGSDHHFEG